MTARHTNISPTMKKLSAYIAGARNKKLPPAVMARAKLHVVDTFAAMISGSRLTPGKKAIAYVKSQGGVPVAGVVGTRFLTSAVNAALANGMCGHADETDDTHPPTFAHPGTSVVPTALAIGEQYRMSGEQVLRSIVLGYDICARLLLALKPQPFLRSGHHPGAFGQVFGAAACAGSLFKFDARQVRHLLAYTGEHAAGLYTMFRDHEHVEKAYGMGGMPAHNGTASALMVAQGWSGVDDLFSGERDFFFAFAPDADRSELIKGLGRNYEILRGGIKRWPVGGPIQGPLHVLQELIQQHDINAAQIARLVVRIPDKELDVVSNSTMPDVCIQHLLAVMLIDGGITFASAHDTSRMKDPQVRSVRKKIQAIGDPALTDALRTWRCVMEITLKDGRILHHQTLAAKGSFSNPLTPEEEQDKAIDLLVPVLGKPQSLRLLKQLWQFEKIKDVRTLRKLYAA